MSFTWQDAMAIGAAVAAVAYVVRHVRRTAARRKSTGCGACTGCSPQPRREPLVQIDPGRKP